MVKSFQSELAQTLLERYSGDLSSLAILFPSLRARTFFNSALAEHSDKPCWQPRWMTIDEIMESVSGLMCGDRIRLIAELYKVYKKYHPLEQFDKFYFWGDMLIADFDMIDKYLVEAKQLLRNIEDIKELEADVSYLSPEQLRIISFWKSIGDGESLSEHKQRFLNIWRTLPAIYEEYRERLISLGFAYPGLIHRMAIERIKAKENIKLPKLRFIVAGFNALSECEKRLFRYLSESECGAEFYWDYDDYYVDNPYHEAGMFMRGNIEQFPAADAISSSNFTQTKKSITSVACVSNVVQCKYVANILRQLGSDAMDKRTAIVLTDENMLIPLLHSMPKSVDRVNVTMGYPLKNTLAYSLVERLVELQLHSRPRANTSVFYHVDVCGLLSHPYIIDCCGEVAKSIGANIVTNRLIYVEPSLFNGNDTLSVMFSKHDDWHSFAKYMLDVISALIGSMPKVQLSDVEYLRIAHDEIAKIMNSVELAEIVPPPSVKVFASLVRRHLQTITIPYEGEPLEGVQIMGILETRNIDFDNVILLSMNDANFPSDKTGQSSFIPYNLRAAYSMPTPEHHEAMYAYYFYRLIQRAKRVAMLYCSRADDKSTGECSRYIHQLEYESPYKIEKRTVGVDLSVDDVEPIKVAKGEREQAILNRYLDPEDKASLSPTALFRYVECPMKFYLHSVAKLRTQDEVSETIDALMFGNILHDSMQELYDEFKDVANPKLGIASKCKREEVERVVDKHISELIYHSDKSAIEEFSGDTILVRDIIVRYITDGIAHYDAEQDGYTIRDLEGDVEYDYPISAGRMVKLYGRADRIDERADGTLQIIDYKSGNVPHLEFNGVDNLFRGKAQERVSNIFQTLLYSMMLHKINGVESMPTLYFASRMMSDDYSPNIIDTSTGAVVERYTDVAEQFEDELNVVLEELFDYDKPFEQCGDEDMCKYCDFKSICRR
ncbi:MAG: PD-(D/E)XK nuclease family protein [Alistipes sp.]|nr:PD-(D/E)XK nuclease family protein [Alistipes sp.]